MLELNRSIRSNAEWREQVSACKASGMTGVEYAPVHGLNVKSFYNARRRLGSRSMGDGPSKPEFKRVEVTGEGPPGVPRTRRWRVTLYGRRVMGTSRYLRDHDFPKAYSKIAA